MVDPARSPAKPKVGRPLPALRRGLGQCCGFNPDASDVEISPRTRKIARWIMVFLALLAVLYLLTRL